MRLSEWQTRAPHKDSMTPKVLAVIVPVMTALGAEDDPSCWVVWGDDPAVRYAILVPTDAGLLQVLARVNVPGEGPRASAKLIRWNRLQLGELALEMAGGHRLLGFQVESYVLHGADDDGDAMASFALELFSRVDGRPFTPRASKRRGGAKGGAPRVGAGTPPTAKSAAAKSAAAKSATVKSAVVKSSATVKSAVVKPPGRTPAGMAATRSDQPSS